MKCLDIERFLDAYLDDEFDERERLEFELHLAECDPCRRAHDQHVELRASIRDALRSPAPDTLRQRISLALDDAPQTSPRHWTRWKGWRTVSLAAAAAALAGLTFVGLSTEPEHLSAGLGSTLTAAGHADPQPSEDPLVHESIDWHRKRLPMEVTGPHSDVVGTWFRDKVDFPVRLPRFHAQNISLLGGRLAHVQDRKAALLTLEVNQRKLSMMVVPSRTRADQPQQPRVSLRASSGYNIAIVHSNGITYVLTSDLPQRDLHHIVRTSFPIP